MPRRFAHSGPLTVGLCACCVGPSASESGTGAALTEPVGTDTSPTGAAETAGATGTAGPSLPPTSSSSSGGEAVGCPMPGDPCGAWCDAPMEVLWCLEDFPLPTGIGDGAVVAVDPAGNIVIAVDYRPHQWPWRAALFSVSPEGQLRWSQSSEHGFRVRDVAALADGSTVLAGMQGEEAVLRVHGGDGALLHERREYGARLGALGSFGDGGFVAAGSESGTLRIERLTRDLAVEWVHTATDEEAYADVWAQQIAVSPCGSIAVGHSMASGEVMLVLGPDGALIRQVEPADAPEVNLLLVAFGADDRIVLTNELTQDGGLWGRYVAYLDPWTGAWSPVEFQPDSFGALLLDVVVVPTASGEDLVWASHGGDSATFTSFLQRVRAGGTVWGLPNIPDPAATFVVGIDLARSDVDATLVVGGGYHDHPHAAWLCKFRP